MNKIFKDAALAKYDKLMESRTLYPKKEYEKAIKDFTDVQKELKAHIINNEEALKAYLKLDSAFGEYEAYTEEHSFIRGFMEGVKFLNRLNQDLQSLKEDDEEGFQDAV